MKCGFSKRAIVSFAVPCPNEDCRTVERAFQSVCSKHFPRDVTRSCEHLNLGFRNIKMIQRPLRCHFMNVKVRRKRILKGVRPQCDGSNTQLTT